MGLKTITVPIFTPGKHVWYDGRTRIVESILLSNHRVMVKLYEMDRAVDSEDIMCEPTVFTYEERTR
jgi:hypothetical protein